MGDKLILIKNKKLAIWSIVLQLIALIYVLVNVIRYILYVGFEEIAHSKAFFCFNVTIISNMLCTLISVYIIVKIIICILKSKDITNILRTIILLCIVNIMSFLIITTYNINNVILVNAIYNNIFLRVIIYVCLPTYFCYNVIRYLKSKTLDKEPFIIIFIIMTFLQLVLQIMFICHLKLAGVRIIEDFMYYLKDICIFLISKVGLLLLFVSIDKNVINENNLETNI